MKIFRRLLVLASFSCGALGLYSHFSHEERPHVTIIGGVNMADGLGRQSVEMIDAVRDSIDVSFKKTYISSLADIPKEVIPVLKKKRRHVGRVIVCQEPLAGSVSKLTRLLPFSQVRIAYSMIESTRIPKEWVERLNRHFDLVAVPDRFLVEVYEKSGVTIPVFEVPLGRNFAPLLKSDLKKKRNSHFVFGSFGAGLGRKNHVGLIRAFRKAFQGRSDVSLYIHCRIADPKVQKIIEEEIRGAEGVLIQFTVGELGSKEYIEFLKQIDCYLSPSKGEGFSIQPREAMALGIPVIATDNTAQHSICLSGLVKSVPSLKGEPALYEWNPEPLGSFFPCSEEDLADALREVEQNYEEYLCRGIEARNWAAQYDYEFVKPLYMTLFAPQKVVLGKENRVADGVLVTSSQKLYKKYKALKKEKGKVLKNSPPLWMMEQIQEDLSSCRKVKKEEIDLAFSELKGKAVRFQIQNNQLKVTYLPTSEERGASLTAALKKLLKITQLPDVDFIVTLQDSAEEISCSIPIFSFAKDAKSKKAVILIPDFEAFGGYRNELRQVKVGSEKYPWHLKKEKAIWRGAMTGLRFTVDNFLTAPRSQLISQALMHPEEIDAAFIGTAQCEDPEKIQSAYGPYFSSSINIENHLAYKYQILVDGNSCAYSRAYWQLFSNSVIFKQDSSNIQWYYRCLIPYVHYIPVASDFADLREKIEWAKNHDELAQRISKNGRLFALKNLQRDDVLYYLYLLICEYAKSSCST